jgi:hypothetical protein
MHKSPALAVGASSSLPPEKPGICTGVVGLLAVGHATKVESEEKVTVIAADEGESRPRRHAVTAVGMEGFIFVSFLHS